MASLFLALKKYIVSRFHRALGIGPLFNRMSAAEGALSRVEETSVRIRQRLESQTELIQSNTTRFEEQINSGVEQKKRLEVIEQSEGEVRITLLDVRDAVKNQGGRVATLEKTLEKTSDDLVRAGRTVSAMRETAAAESNRLNTVQKTVGDFRNNLATVSDLVGLQAARVEAIESEVTHLGASEKTIDEVKNGLTAVDALIKDQAIRLGAAEATASEAIRQAGTLRNVAAMQADRIAATEGMASDALREIGTIQEMAAAQADRIATAHNVAIASQRNASQIESDLSEVRKQYNELGLRVSAFEESASHGEVSNARMDERTYLLSRSVEAMEGWLTAMQRQVAEYEARRDNLDARSGQIEAILDSVRDRLARMEERLITSSAEIERQTAAAMKQHADDFAAAHGPVLAAIESKLASEAGESTAELEAFSQLRDGLAATVSSLGELKSEVVEKRQRVEHVDQQITRLDGTLSDVKSRLDSLEDGLGAVQADGLNHVEQRVIALAERLAEREILKHTGGNAATALAPAKVGLYTRPAADEPPVHFLITSFGYAASRWLAWALNLHPDVVCSHGLNDARLGLIYDRDFTREEWEAVFAGQKARREMTLTEFFAELEAVGPAKAYGNVHHYRIGELARHVEQENCRVPYVCAELIRHPISIIESRFQASLNSDIPATRLDKSLARFRRNLPKHMSQSGFSALVERFDVDLAAHETAMFFEAIQLARYAGEEIARHPTQRFIVMEKMTTDPQYFVIVFEMMFGGRLVPNKDYLDRVFAGKPLNRHRAKGVGRLPRQDYESWFPWQRAAVSHMIKKSVGAEHWERFGYDLSFLD